MHSIKKFLTKNKTQGVPQPCSSDLLAAEFFLFLKLKVSLKGPQFLSEKEM
jgi:hypothetical protein